MGQQAASMKRSTASIRPSRTATHHSFTWRSHRIGTACAATRGSRNVCDRWRFLRSRMRSSATCSGCGSYPPAYGCIALSNTNYGSRTDKALRMSRIVITGAPGAGKTTLLLALQARGYTIVPDTARAIIQDRRRRGLSPRPDPYVFAQETLRIDIENFIHHAPSSEPVFFERGVLDSVCGLDRLAPLNESELSVWLSKYRYFSKVFVLPPWKAIYV